MKNVNLLVFSIVFSFVLGFVFLKPMKQYQYMTSYKESKKMPLLQRIEGRAEERANLLRNVSTGEVNPDDWYRANAEIIKLHGNGLKSRAGDIVWENQGPDQVAGRTRGFVFDKTKEGRVFCGGVAGGMYVSDNLGHNWRPVPNMAEVFKALSIGCLTQSKDGDIYAGTGEYWGNPVTGAYQSNHYGNGIYKKEAGSDEWTALTETIGANAFNPVSEEFRQVLDISCSPTDNGVVYAATSSGMHKSTDAGATWTKLSGGGIPTNGVIAQVEVALDGTTIYAAWSGRVWKSIDEGATWDDLIGNQSEYVANGNQHVRIAVSHQDQDKVYACGITGSNGGDLKYVIKTEDGGVNWEFLGKRDATLNPLCGDLGCQGFYDLCLAVHPQDDDKIFLGGSLKAYSWSKNLGWVQATNWNNPAELGLNLVHADKHEFAFHPTHPDTMVICTDGGPYITYNSNSGFPTPTWKPIWTNLNITTFYDMDVNKYGELVGGSQDNGTQFITLKGFNNNTAIEISGGDGFDCAISAGNDYKVAFSTVYTGTVNRTTDLSSTRSSVASGCVEEGGKFPNIGFHTRIGLVEKIDNQTGGIDTVEKSFFFVFDHAGKYTISNNAYDPAAKPAFTGWFNPGIGNIYRVHSSKNLEAVYICGVNGVRKTTELGKQDSFSVNTQVQNQPCLNHPNLSWTAVGGATNNIGSIYVDQNNPDYVVATQFGFGGSNKVYLTEDGQTFVGKQGDLPIMPVYACAIDPDDSKHVAVGTEFGIWETDDITASSPTWTEANTNIGRVPVYRLRVNYLNSEECTMLYAGTFGRGFFRAPFPKKDGCDYIKKARPSTSSIYNVNNNKVSFEVYPNPSSNKLNVAFNSKKSGNYTLSVYDMAGRNVKRINYKAIVGDNLVTTEIHALQNGQYIIRLEDKLNVVGGTTIVKN